MSSMMFFVGCAVIYFAQAATINEGPKPQPALPVYPAIPAVPERINDFFTKDSESHAREEGNIGDFDQVVAEEYYNALNESAKNAQSLNLEELSKLGKQDIAQANNEKRLGVSVFSKNLSAKDPKNNMNQEMFIQVLNNPPSEDDRVQKMKSRLEEFQKQFDFENTTETDIPEVYEIPPEVEEENEEAPKEENLDFSKVRVINDSNVFINFNKEKRDSAENVYESKAIDAKNIENNEDLYIIKQRPDRLYPTFIIKNADLYENEVFNDLLDNGFNNFASSIRDKYQDMYTEDEDVDKKISEVNKPDGDLNPMDDAFLESIISEAENKNSNFSFPISKYFSTAKERDLDMKILKGLNATDLENYFKTNENFTRDFATIAELLKRLNETMDDEEFDDGKIDAVLLDFLKAADKEKVLGEVEEEKHEEIEDKQEGGDFNEDDDLFKANIVKLVNKGDDMEELDQETEVGKGHNSEEIDNEKTE